ncbi:hypothetical protein [Salinispira pacifica]|uniref:Uncharacterized protein n=1 Tax=Salinispira pacifica TaxID=1307761 RepID=V5WH30_9SPIO|nr:hypothetical protein [Salinispira pacifica]AHC15127.1 hypothetical protein L21SP2_1748 [Salinispira pacifica]
MEDRIVFKDRDVRLEILKEKIRDPMYLQYAVQKIAGNLTEEYYSRTQQNETQSK